LRYKAGVILLNIKLKLAAGAPLRSGFHTAMPALPLVGDIAQVFGHTVAYPRHELAIELERWPTLQ
jgi:hypothetical protein